MLLGPPQQEEGAEQRLGADHWANKFVGGATNIQKSVARLK